MFGIIGIVVAIASVIGGYAPHGDLKVLWQPLEYLIILGGAFGAFMLANPKPTLFAALRGFGKALKGPPHSKASYLELLIMLYSVFRLAKSKGMLALESHVENPEESNLFENFPNFMKDHHAVEFLCDYLRLLTLGTDNPHEVEAMMQEEIEVHHSEGSAAASAIAALADGLPAFGIVAAVLGVIVTMGSITEPPEVLGKLIGGALVGTFAGIVFSYAFFAPFAGALRAVGDAETKYYSCIKAGILAYLQGYAPQVCVEFARKTLFSHERPTFAEVEEAIQEAPKV
ncbi:MAG: flagellar motor stator protein MotA [Alphaproteobacteria bacterium]|nr:flagellar motor stator protein MotA [Alphaproteobacteria bacterium]